MTAKASPRLRLPKLPERGPVKLTVALDPALHATLQAYAALYRETYGADEPVTELVPHMLKSFMDGDRSFIRARRARPVASEDK